ncbi:MAG: sialidase family protein [Flavobacteriaceae bacterium]
MKRKVKKFSLLSLILIVTVQCTDTNLTKSNKGVKPEGTQIAINEKAQYLGDSTLGVRKIKDVVIYKDSMFFSTFPSVITRPDGEILVAFRRAPDRKIFGESKTNHVDPNSYLVMVKSSDNGETWTKKAELIYSHPFGGSQDPCLLQLKDGTLLCASYGWAFLRPDGLSNLKQPNFINSGNAVFLGGYLVRSDDGGKNWGDVIYPPHIEPEIFNDAFSNPVATYNRGALYEANDGKILWIVAAHDTPTKTSNHLITSKDKGLTWDYVSPVAIDSKISFNEASIIETPKGDLVGFLRTENFEDQAVISRSTDGGKTFKWESMGFQGHPLNAMRLKDNRVLLTYGYRHKPYGIRARILNSECTDFATAPEIVLREDGGSTDIGYTWATQYNDNQVLVIYYFNQENGTRYIAGTILEIENR